MNGTLFQLARLVSYVRTSLNSGSVAQFPLRNTEDSIIYKSAYGDTISSSEEWVNALGERKLKHIFLLIDVAGNNREHAGFANVERQSIITIFPDNREYDTLSQELYVQTREAVMFAVNS